MSQILVREIDKLKNHILAMSARVEESLALAISSISGSSAEEARKVISDDRNIDLLENEIEEECLKILALHQPVASDLRFIVAVLKINHDLERIGDLSANMSKRSIELANRPDHLVAFDFNPMFQVVRAMLRKALDSLIFLDKEKAIQVLKDDEEIDAMHKNVYALLKENIHQDPHKIDTWLEYLTISRNLERIGDHAKSLAKDAIYLIDGEIVRHNTKKLKHPPKEA